MIKRGHNIGLTHQAVRLIVSIAYPLRGSRPKPNIKDRRLASGLQQILDHYRKVTNAPAGGVIHGVRDSSGDARKADLPDTARTQFIKNGVRIVEECRRIDNDRSPSWRQ